MKKEDVKYYNFQKQSMKKFTNLIIKFSKKFPDEIIYVRPHPTEKVEYWMGQLSEELTIRLDKDYESNKLLKRK